jgi:AraC-like DNA-binding protein
MRYKFNPLVDADNEILLAELCLWFEKNIDSNIGWKELSAISKLTHTELQFLFDKYKQTTPMTYIRKQKEQNKKVQPVYTITKNFLAKPRE